MPRAFLFLLCLVPAIAAHGQTILGAGGRPCSEWARARAGGGRAYEAEQWALGYLSAVNAGRSGGAFRSLDEKTVFGGIDSYCSAHPTDLLWSAVKSVLAPPHSA